jgi:hypothetical protein
MDNKKKFTRKDLYELVWSEPQRKVAEMLGIKTWHLMYLCEKHNIPRSESGHWTKWEAGLCRPGPELPLRMMATRPCSVWARRK